MSDEQQPEEGPRPAQRQRMEEQLQRAKNLLAGARGKESKTYEGLKGQHVVVEEGAFPTRCALLILNCEDCTIDIEARCAKISLTSCSNVTINLKGKILTQIVETNKSKNLEANFHVPVGTLQIDVCDDFNVTFQKQEHFGSLVWVGCNNLHLSFEDAEDRLHTGVNHVRPSYPDVDVDQCQFKVTKVGEELLNEPLMRLPNGFSTTQREHDEFEARRERNLNRLADHVEQMLRPEQRQQQGDGHGRGNAPGQGDQPEHQAPEQE